MPYIETVPPEEATGLLAREYRAAVERAGHVFNVVRIQSLNVPVMRASLRLYKTLMMGRGPLDRATREMLATVTSRALDCFY